MITISKLKDYVDHGHDSYQLAKWLINVNIAKYVPLNLSDLSDTATVANEIEAVAECINEGDYQDALNIAEESAVQILDEEGFDLSK